MTRLRNIFVTPAAALMLLTIAVPAAIICVYSFLSRGAYGGVELPWTLENYSRLIDPLYGGIFVRSVALAAVATVICIVLGFPLALFIAQLGSAQESVFESGDSAVLDQLSDPPLCVDVSAA